jgi:hypothetical protein
MNDELETRLAALRPADLPPGLQAHLAAPPLAPGKIRWLWAATVPLAAAALWLLMPAVQPPVPLPVPKTRAPQPSDFHVFVPVQQTSTLVGLENITVIDTEPAHPIRLVRASWIVDVTYAGDDGHSTIHRREPRSQIIPIALQTY